MAYTQTSGRDNEGVYLRAGSMPGASRATNGSLRVTVGQGGAGRRLAGLALEIPWYEAARPSLPRRPAEDADILEGRYGNPVLRYRLFRSDNAGEELEEITDHSDASVSMSNYRDHRYELSFGVQGVVDLREVLDPFRDYVKADARLWDPLGQEWKDYPLGLYRLWGPEAEHNREGTTWTLTGRSPETNLIRESAHLGHAVGPGTGVLAEATAILRARGVPGHMISFPPPGEDRELGTGMYFDPRANPDQTPWLRVINRLFAAGGFHALYTDAGGRFTTRRLTDRADREPQVLYSSRRGSSGALRGELLVVEDLRDSFDDDRFANRVIVMSEDVNTSPPIYVIAENNDPNSPASIPSIGVFQKDPITLQNVASRDVAEDHAREALARSSGFNHQLAFSTVPEPRRGPWEVYELDILNDHGAVVAEGNWFVTGWTLPLSGGESPGEAMTHEVSTVEDAGEVVDE